MTGGYLEGWKVDPRGVGNQMNSHLLSDDDTLIFLLSLIDLTSIFKMGPFMAQGIVSLEG